MFNINEYNNLALKYGSCASWAVWDYKKENDTLIISQNYKQLHSKFIFLGLNISRSLINDPWINFHNGKHDRKIKFASNDNKLRGSYITDIFKDLPEPNSNKIDDILTLELIDKNVKLFNQEMRDIKISDDTKFIIFGKKAFEEFNKHFKQNYKNKIIYHRHYSSWGTDKEWVEDFWRKLNIIQNFDLTIEKYKII